MCGAVRLALPPHNGYVFKGEPMVRGVVGTKSNVAAAVASTPLLAGNGNRTHLQIHNDSAAIMYLDTTGGTASAASYTDKVPADGSYENPNGICPMGNITAFWPTATGNARITEWQ